MLNMLLWIGRMNDSNFFLKTDIDSELLIFSSRLNQSLKAEGKKEKKKKKISPHNSRINLS